MQFYALMNSPRAGGAIIGVWQQDPDTGMLQLVRHKSIGKEPGVAMDVSPDGALLAVSTTEGTAMVRVRGWR